MTREEYFLDALGESLSDLGIFHSLTSDQRNQIAIDICTAHDCIDMAFPGPGGYGNHTPHKSDEVIRLEAKVKCLEADLADVTRSFKQNVSSRRGWDIRDIALGKDGNAYKI